MNRIAQQEFSLPKYDKLMDRMNKLSMAIKIHHYPLDTNDEQQKQARQKAKEHCMCPTWDNVVGLLEDAMHELSKDRYNPRKY